MLAHKHISCSVNYHATASCWLMILSAIPISIPCKKAGGTFGPPAIANASPCWLYGLDDLEGQPAVPHLLGRAILAVPSTEKSSTVMDISRCEHRDPAVVMPGVVLRERRIDRIRSMRGCRRSVRGSRGSTQARASLSRAEPDVIQHPIESVAQDPLPSGVVSLSVHGSTARIPVFRNSSTFRVLIASPRDAAVPASMASGRWSSSGSPSRRLASMI